MDPENLKMILDALAGVTSETKTVLLFYFGSTILLRILSCLTVFGLVWLACKTVLKFNKCSTSFKGDAELAILRLHHQSNMSGVDRRTIEDILEKVKEDK